MGHENRVSCLGVSNDGISLCTGSWDAFVRNSCLHNFNLPLTDDLNSSRCGPINHPFDVTICITYWIPDPPIAPPGERLSSALLFLTPFLPVSNPTLFARLLNRRSGGLRTKLPREPLPPPRLCAHHCLCSAGASLIRVISAGGATTGKHANTQQLFPASRGVSDLDLFSFSLSLITYFLCTIVFFWRLRMGGGCITTFF